MSKDSALTNFELNPSDANIMVRFVGELNENLKFIEKTFNVKIFQNGNQIKIQGSKKDITLSEDALKRLYATAGQGIEITKETLHLCIQDLNMEKDSHEIVIKTPKKSIIPRSRNQKIFLNNITDNEINFGIGPAGTGKTYLAVAAAVDALLKEKVDRIILIRPAVEAGEKLGFLPGDLSQKVDPYLRPLYDALYEMLGIEKTEKFLIRGIIEIAPLAYMRGRTLNNSFIIVDESQNTTKEQMKMILTRMGFGSNLVINGDLTQVDLPKNIKSGLSHAIEVINGTDGIGFTTFESVDVVRHPLVKKIIDALNVIKPPFNINGVAQLAAAESLKDKKFINRSVKHNLFYAKKLKKFLEIYNISSNEISANFLFLNFDNCKTSAKYLYQKLKQKGVILRSTEDGYGIKNKLRLTIGSKEENFKFMNAVKGILN